MAPDSSLPRLSVDPCDPGFIQDPYTSYEKWRTSHPVFFWDEYEVICFARHRDVNAILRDHRFGRQILHVATREELGLADPPAHLEPFYRFESRSLLELEPPVHTRLRALINKAFLLKQIERLRPLISNYCAELIAVLREKKEFDLIADFATPIPVRLICQMLGVPVAMAPRFLSWSHDMVGMYQARRDRALEDAAVQATLEFTGFMRNYVQERRKCPGDDLLSELIKAEEQGQKLTEEELVTTAILLLNAGHEATVHMIGNTVKTLLEEGIHDGIDPQTVEESIRFDPPLHLFKRYALEDLVYEGIRLKKGQQVGLLLASANRDTEVFASAGQFIRNRVPNPHVSFGAGIHYCVGAPLARLEMQIAIPMLFESFPNMKLMEKPKYRDIYHFHGLETLHIRI